MLPSAAAFRRGPVSARVGIFLSRKRLLRRAPTSQGPGCHNAGSNCLACSCLGYGEGVRRGSPVRRQVWHVDPTRTPPDPLLPTLHARAHPFSRPANETPAASAHTLPLHIPSAACCPLRTPKQNTAATSDLLLLSARCTPT